MARSRLSRKKYAHGESSNTTTKPNMPQFYVSAPGKVILFGEHSAVYGKPAIAAALSLRAYLLVSPSASPDEIVLEFPDIFLVHKWKTADIPWDTLEKIVPRENGVPQPTELLIPEVLECLAPLLSDTALNLHYTACRCFLYLYVSLCGPQIAGHHFCIRLTLPIGAGLGSSASTAVCLASALSALAGHIQTPLTLQTDPSNPAHTPDLDFIDRWSFMGEKCFHGTPSGIDNAVATHGGAVLYQKMQGNSSVRNSIRNFSALRLLLTNSKVPRSTAELVGNVARQNSLFPEISNSILDAMGHVVKAAYELILAPEPRKRELEELVNINHGLLVALGVSHPRLEEIKIIADEHKLGATKLTGAGGGGCAITILDDAVLEKAMADAEQAFRKKGLETFSATLGGKGVGMLRPENSSDERFSMERFALLESRESVEEMVAPNEVDGWKYW